MTSSSYTNPVYPEYFADPFVWQHQGTYYAIGTGPAEAAGAVNDLHKQKVFPLLRSPDLNNWEFTGNALKRPDPALGDNFWAPEIAYCDGRFYLYYSVGHEDKHHQLRVAASADPLGPYEDVGAPLVDPKRCAFAIDPSPFQDDDGQWYLFYAQDFLDSDDGVRPGTALVVDRLVTMTQLAGEPTVVLRARHDWQRFLADRPMYGGIYDWHTLEGPCVRKHHNRYYCFYSGGRWETDSYGVDYGVADHVMGPYSDAGNESGPRVLRSLPDKVLGPGHNSFATSPDGSTEYVVYHAWDIGMNARRMCIDRLLWTAAGPRCVGPTWTPQAFSAGQTPHRQIPSDSPLSNVVTGNAATDAQQYRGWFIGKFVTPTDDPRSTSAVEVKWGLHPTGDRRSDWAPPADTTTLSILVSGCFHVQFPDGEAVLTSQGDYALWLPGVSHSWWAEEDSVIVTVRWKDTGN